MIDYNCKHNAQWALFGINLILQKIKKVKGLNKTNVFSFFSDEERICTCGYDDFIKQINIEFDCTPQCFCVKYSAYKKDLTYVEYSVSKEALELWSRQQGYTGELDTFSMYDHCTCGNKEIKTAKRESFLKDRNNQNHINCNKNLPKLLIGDLAFTWWRDFLDLKSNQKMPDKWFDIVVECLTSIQGGYHV